MAATGLGSEPSAGSKYMDKECKSTPIMRANARRKSRLLSRVSEISLLYLVIGLTSSVLIILLLINYLHFQVQIQ
jgi:hypothetical protein